jgi:hypothetical protein
LYDDNGAIVFDGERARSSVIPQMGIDASVSPLKCAR